jgi:hypothetical protein
MSPAREGVGRSRSPRSEMALRLQIALHRVMRSAYGIRSAPAQQFDHQRQRSPWLFNRRVAAPPHPALVVTAPRSSIATFGGSGCCSRRAFSTRFHGIELRCRGRSAVRPVWEMIDSGLRPAACFHRRRLIELECVNAAPIKPSRRLSSCADATLPIPIMPTPWPSPCRSHAPSQRCRRRSEPVAAVHFRRARSGVFDSYDWHRDDRAGADAGEVVARRATGV